MDNRIIVRLQRNEQSLKHGDLIESNPFAKSGKGVESWFRVNGPERGHGVKQLSN
jgi:hypothetical protein